MNCLENVMMKVNPFGKEEGFSEKRSQNIADARGLKDPLIAKVMEYYPVWRGYDRFDEIDACTPEQIDDILQMISSNYPADLINNHHTGQFISNLMVKSFAYGYNDFTLRTADSCIDSLPAADGNDIPYGEPLRYTLIGNTGHIYLMHKVVGTHKGNMVGNAFYSCKRSKITIYGDVEGVLGEECEACDFTIHGDAAGGLLYGAKFCNVTLYGDISEEVGMYSQSCTFKVVKEETFETCISNITREEGSNRVQLINPDGSVIKEVMI